MERTAEEMIKIVEIHNAKIRLAKTDLKIAKMAEESLAFCDALVALIVTKGLVTAEEMEALPSISTGIRDLVAERASLRELIE